VPCIALIEDIDGVFHGRKNISGGNAEMSAFLRNAEMMGRDGQDGQGGDGEDTISQPKEASGEDGEGRQQRQMRRPQIPMNSGLTFDCLLNVLDGVERLEGVFVIITTNDITKVDPAIGQPTGDNGSTRPGRIDRVIELRNMAKF
jgi:SpoVK/Ycf46/Vps4 family AAA+-type ATPase